VARVATWSSRSTGCFAQESDLIGNDTVAKQARTTRRLGSPTKPPQRGTAGVDRRWRLGIIAGVVIVVVAGLAVAAIAFAAAFTSVGSGGLPPGTQVFAENDHTHVTTPVTYDRLPPAGGPHNPTPLNCGVYTQPVPNENAVHSLEHGTVWITYQPNLPTDQLASLQQLVVNSYVGTERYLILSPFAGIESPIVASAWGAQLDVNSPSDSGLVAFIQHYAGGAQGGEPGGRCTGGVGSPAE